MDKVYVAAVGDVMIGREVESFNPDREPWRSFAGCDVVFGNVEAPLTARGVRADKPITMRSSPACADELKRLGFNVLTVANNHALDYGVDGLRDTLQVLRDVGIGVVGGGENVEQALGEAICDIRGVSVAFIGVSCTLPVGSAAGVDRPGIAPIRVSQSVVVDATVEEQPGTAPFCWTEAVESDVQRVCEKIASVRAEGRVVIVGIHWGVPPGWMAPFQGYLATYQRPLGKRLVAAGADAVIGHHSHCIHGLEIVDGRPVFYGLGNLVFHRWHEVSETVLERPGPPYDLGMIRCEENYEALVVRLEVVSGVTALEIVPVVMDDQGEPEEVDGERARGILKRFAAMSQLVGTDLVVGDGLIRVEL